MVHTPLINSNPRVDEVLYLMQIKSEGPAMRLHECNTEPTADVIKRGITTSEELGVAMIKPSVQEKLSR